MTARASEACRKMSVDLAKEAPERIRRMVPEVKQSQQKMLDEWLNGNFARREKEDMIGTLSMPRGINWKIMRELYEFKPRNYEELLAFKGVGPATVRGLALISELIYGEGPSWQDPVKYSFAFGGKDGVPYPVDRKAMDSSIEIVRQAVEECKIGNNDRLKSLKRLRRFAAKAVEI